jgi:hypothetical protein
MKIKVSIFLICLLFLACKKDPSTIPTPVAPNPVIVPPPFVLNVSVYPNPCTGIFTVKTNDTQPDTVIITNIVGQVKFNQSINGTTVIDIIGLQTGIYFVEVFSGKNKQIKKLIIQ